MKNYLLLGIVGVDQNGELFYLPIRGGQEVSSQNMLNLDKAGNIVRAPSPEEVEIGKETERDFSVEGIIKKHEMSKEGVSK